MRSLLIIMFALTACMRLLRVCKTRVLNFGPAQPKHYRTAMRAFFPPAVLYTDLHAVACNLSKLNTRAKIRASHYRACFALSAGTADYLACIYLLKCCSVPYMLLYVLSDLFCTCATCVYMCMDEQCISIAISESPPMRPEASTTENAYGPVGYIRS